MTELSSPSSPGAPIESETATEHDRPAPGRTVADRYVLAAGTSSDERGETFRAHDRLLGRAVTVTLVSDTGRRRSRRLREAQVLAGLAHPALLTVYDAGRDAATGSFVVSQFVSGPTLAERLDRGPLEVAITARLGAVLAGGLLCVHRHGMVHRAVSPAAVVYDGDDRPFLVGFSLARAADAPDDAAITVDTVETPRTGCYLAPEQVTGEPVGPPADLYALGLLLLECLTGHPEYAGEPVQAAEDRLRRAPVIPDDLPAPLSSLLTRMTDAVPEYRPDARQVGAELARIGTAPDGRLSSEAPPPYRPAPRPLQPDTDRRWGVPSGDGSTAAGPGRTPDADRSEVAIPHRPGPPASADAGSPARPTSRSRDRQVWVAVAAALLLCLTAAAIVVIGPTRARLPASPSPAPRSAAAVTDQPLGPPTLYGTVVDVPDPAIVDVAVGGTRVAVSVLGIDPGATPPCARPGALEFARRTLDGQAVTLVPDPTLAPDPVGVHRAYVVLATQLSYTDAAVGAGWVRPGDSRALYRPSFDREAQQAQDAALGMWSASCTSAEPPGPR